MARTLAAMILILTGGMATTGAWAGSCESPSEPAGFPDPGRATEPEMVAAQQGVKQYLSGMEARLKCLEAAKETDRYNDAVAQMQKVAGKFNAVVRAYRTRSAG